MTRTQRLHRLREAAQASRTADANARDRRAILDSVVLLALAEGINPTDISRETGLSRETVYKAARRRQEREQHAGRAS
jgi:hypothetical protein